MAETKETKETKKELAFILFDEGKRPSAPDVKALGLKSRSTYVYFQEWKKGHPEADGTTTGKPGGSAIKGGIATTPLVVGKITITPENWGMNQEGAILILDTYNKAKRDLAYGGTIGDFLCDICEFYRRVLNYREVEYAGSTANQGGGGAKEDGGKSPEPAAELIQS